MAAAAPSTGAAASSAAEFKEQGNDCYRNGKYGDAIQAYTQAMEAVGDDVGGSVALWTNRAAAYFMTKSYKKAVQDCQRAIEIDSSFDKAYLRCAKAYLAMGEFTKANAMYTQALLRDPMNAAALRERKVVILTEQRIAKAKEYIAQGDYGTAGRLVNAARGDAPASRDLQEMRAQVLLGQHKYDDAYALTTELLPQYPNSVPLVQVRAAALARQGNIEGAITNLRAALRSDPDATAIKTELRRLRDMEKQKVAGNDAFKAQRWQEAIAAYGAALALDPLNAPFNSRLLANRAAAKMKLRNWGGAADDCSKCLELDEDYLKAYMRRAQCLKEMGDASSLEQACRDLESAKRMVEDRTTMRSLERDLREYKALLKAAKRKDYYKILGVPRSADDAAIKKAYRKMALKCHPDRFASKSEAEKNAAEAQFKDINEAHGVLSDANKKRRYDAGVDIEDLDNEHAGHGGFHGGGGGGGGMHPDMANDVFRMFFGGGGGGGGGRGGGGMGGFHFG